MNDVVARAFASAGFPVSKEPAGPSRADGKCPDGITWQADKPVVWDVTVICTTADSYVDVCQLPPARFKTQLDSVQLLSLIHI